MKDGIIRVDDALAKAQADGMPALAVTDLNNVMSSVHFYEEARKTGVKPILGVDVTLENPEQDDKNTKPNLRMTFLLQNEKGYHNANAIISRAFIENNKASTPLIKREWLDTMALDGVIALTGATEGRIGQLLAEGRSQEAEEEVKSLKEVFSNDRLFIELQRDGHAGQEAYIREAVQLAAKTDTPVVATHMNQFLSPEDYDAHEVRVIVAEGDRLDNPNRKTRFTREQYFKTTAEMEELFKDIPEAIQNTLNIAQRCNFTMNLGHPELPRFPTPEGETEYEMLDRLAREGLEKRLEVLYPEVTERDAQRPRYVERLDTELKVINDMGFPGYFLIVQDFINWAKDNDIPVGPGRGSGAGSLVAYSVRITDLDPLQYDLLFERFLNPERVSMPDFDIDFCRERRGEVVEYVRGKYGYNNVSQIATAGTMESKAVIKDVARSMGIPPFVAQELSDLIPKEANIPISLERALQEVPKLKEKYETDPEMKKLFDLALKLEGTPRQFGMHAAGVLIAPREITQFTPLYFDGKGVTSHFDMKDMEKLGLVKFDFLGLDTLTVIKKAEELIRQIPGQEKFDISRISMDDAVAYDVFRRGDTTAVFQSEGDGMRKMQVAMKPGNLEDVIASMALYRPGPLGSGMVDDFIARKHGHSVIEYPHPKLEKILQPTYGVIVYQEQVMQIAQELAGYSLGSADLLRRAMGKKKPEEMAEQRVIFTKGAVENGVQEETARGIFDLMERFAEYGFNKSHSAAYGLLAYQTAYLKGHFPQQLYAAAMTCKAEDGKFDKVADLVEDARRNGFPILPPDVNKSDFEFKPEGEKGIRFGLSGVKGVGESAALVIQNEREKNGPYEGFFEFGTRLGKGTVNKRVKEALVNSGSFDGFGATRETYAANLETMQSYIEACEKAANGGSKSKKGAKAEVVEEENTVLSELFETPAVVKAKIEVPVPELLPAEKPWTMLERLEKEYKVFDFYFTGHPYQAYKQELGGLNGIEQLEEIPPSSASLYAAGVVTKVFERKAKSSGNPWASVTISDGKSELDVSLFGETYQNVKPKVKEGEFIVVGGRTKDDTFQGRVQLTGDYVYNAEEVRTLTSKYVKIALPDDAKKFEEVMAVLDSAPKGEGPISSEVIVYKRQEGAAPQKTDVGTPYNVVLTDAVMDGLKAIAGGDYVKLHARAELSPPAVPEKKRNFNRKR